MRNVKAKTIEDEMEYRARQRVLESPHVPVEAVVGAGDAIARGRLFCIRVAGVDLIPQWALDGQTPVPGLASVLNLLCQHRDGWGIAYWFASLNARLGNRAPRDVLRIDPIAVLRAAQAEIDDQLHPHG